MHEEYINDIIDLLKQCTDIPTLDLIHQILLKQIHNAQ